MNQFALFPIFAALVVAPAMAQTKPPTNSVTLAWTNPTTYTTGQALTIGQITVFFDNSAPPYPVRLQPSRHQFWWAGLTHSPS